MPAHPAIAGLFRAAAPDADLLARFVATRDEPAFAALVQRHGPTVWRVCRNLVRQPADAEDAYQATFLLLVRHAAKVRNPAAVGAWLYGAAVKVATRVRTRRKPEPLVGEPVTEPTALADLTVAEAEGVFHEELARLPAKFREPLVLCCLDALTRDEAAARLGVRVAAVKHRLERGRELLRASLLRRGVAVGVPLLAGWLAPAAAAGVPTFQPHTASPAVSQLVHEVGAMLFASRWKSAAVAGLFAVAVGGIGLTLASGGQPKPNDPPVKAKPPEEKPAFDELTAVVGSPGLSNQLPATFTITPDGKCVYDVAGRPGVNQIPAWPAKKVSHTLPPARLKQLTELLKATDWLGKAGGKGGPPPLHSATYTVSLKRDGKPAAVSFHHEQEPYKALAAFLHELSQQEFLLYQLESIPDRSYSANARSTLDSYLRAELGEPFASKPTFPLDYTRFAPWATALVRKPDGKSADDLRTAVRLVAHLRLESERKQLVELVKHEDSYVRRAAGDALDWMSPEAVKLARTLAEYRTKLPPPEEGEKDGPKLADTGVPVEHLTGVAKRLKATNRGEALILFAHLHVESDAKLRYIAAVALNGIYPKHGPLPAGALADVGSLEHRQMLVDFQAALDASGK